MKASSPLRIGFLLTLLVGEAAWIVALRAFGWNETNGGIEWLACLFWAGLPLVVAAIVLVRHRLRFNVRTMLVAMALIATFLYLTVRPLQTAASSRHASRALIAAGATLYTGSSWDNVYAQLKYDPRTPVVQVARAPELAFWLRPLARNLLNTPTDDSIREIGLSNDDQVFALCREAESFPNLERVSLGTGVASAGAEALAEALPRFARLTELQLGIALPNHWPKSLPGIRTLSLWAEGPLAGRSLSGEQLRDIGSLPDLRLLWIFKYTLADADVQLLANSKSLKYVVLRKTGISQSGTDKLAEAMPGCVVQRDE